MTQKHKQPTVRNFVDLRASQSKQPAGLIHDVITPPINSARRRLVVLVLVGSFIVIGFGVLGLAHLHGGHVPSEINTNVNYSVYYPASIPSGYAFAAGSANVQQGVSTFAFVDGTKRIIVTEQATPSAPPDLTHIQGFKTFDGPFGKAAIGSAAGGSTAILLTGTTLITINATNNDPSAVKLLASSLNKVPTN